MRYWYKGAQSFDMKRSRSFLQSISLSINFLALHRFNASSFCLRI